MELKVQCQCGQKYKFDVEPADGRMPHAVNCPVCGADGTNTANEMLAVQFPPQPAATPAPAAPGRLRINAGAAHSPPAAAPAAAVPAPAAAAPARPWLDPSKTVQAPPPPENTENIPLGILGGVIAGGIAMVGWYLLARATDHEYGIVAWLVGVMTGLGVRIMGRDSTALLGAIAGICAALAILGGGFLTVWALTSEFDKLTRNITATAYEEALKDAKVAVKLSSDQDIRTFLAKRDETSAAEVTPADIKEFREKDLPEAQALVDGKISKKDYLAKLPIPSSSFALKFAIFKATLSPFTLLWLIFGVGSAYRIATK